MSDSDEISPGASTKLPLFTPAHSTVLRVALLGAALFFTAVAYAAYEYYHSPYWNRVGYAPAQPVLFSHRHHAGELQIDCRYCHATVETSAFAGMPSTHTCMTCHSQLFTATALLQPVVQSAERQAPLHWKGVNSLPDHVYFNHSIHLAKGVGCTTCHGQIGRMPLTAKGEPLSMRWCVDCHRDPGPRLRPAAEIFAPTWSPPANQEKRGRALLRGSSMDTSHLTNCSTCHH